jgi:hypothetical protein
MDYYRVRVYHFALNRSSLTSPSLIVVAIVVELVCFSSPYFSNTYSAYILMFCSCAPKQGEIIARLTVHTTLRSESKIALAAAASLVA